MTFYRMFGTTVVLLSYGEIMSAAAESVCPTVKDAYTSSSCCSSAVTKDYCWLPNMKLPDLRGNGALYHYEGLNVRNATTLYTFVDPSQDASVMLGDSFFASYTNDPSYSLSAVHDVNNAHVKDIISTTLSASVSSVSLSNVLSDQEVLVVVPGSAYAYKVADMSMVVPGESAGHGKQSLHDSFDGASFAFVECDSAATRLPSGAPAIPVNQVRPQETTSSATVMSRTFPLLYAPPGSGLIVGQSYTLDQLRLGKSKAMLSYHSKWCPTCSASVNLPGVPLFPVGAGHADMSEFLATQSADVADIVLFVTNDYLDDVENYDLFAPLDSVFTNKSYEEKVATFLEGFKMVTGYNTAGAIGFSHISVFEHGSCPLGQTASRMTMFGGSGIPAPCNVSDVLAQYATKIPNSIIVDAGGYGSEYYYTFSNSHFKVIDFSQPSSPKATVTRMALSALEWSGYYGGSLIVKQFFDAIGHPELTEAYSQITPKNPIPPTTMTGTPNKHRVLPPTSIEVVSTPFP